MSFEHAKTRAMNARSLVAVLFLTIGVSTIARANSNTESFATTSYWLSNEQVAKYSEEAMAGSSQAANKLVNWYWMRGIHDSVKTKYWALIGAENGDAESQFRAYQTLKTSSKHIDQQRALFWLKKSAAQEFQFAEAILASCPELSAKSDRGDVPCFGPGSD